MLLFCLCSLVQKYYQKTAGCPFFSAVMSHFPKSGIRCRCTSLYIHTPTRVNTRTSHTHSRSPISLVSLVSLVSLLHIKHRRNKQQILNRTAYQFYYGTGLDGTVTWTSDSTIAMPVWSFPLMTSMQQANYHPTLQRYIFANWAWISYDGHAFLFSLITLSTHTFS